MLLVLDSLACMLHGLKTMLFPISQRNVWVGPLNITNQSILLQAAWDCMAQHLWEGLDSQFSRICCFGFGKHTGCNMDLSCLHLAEAACFGVDIIWVSWFFKAIQYMGDASAMNTNFFGNLSVVSWSAQLKQLWWERCRPWLRRMSVKVLLQMTLI